MPRDLEAPERVLAERLEEELELTTEARERREELLGHLTDEVAKGNVVDVAELGTELDIDEVDRLDLTAGTMLGDPED